VFGNLKFDAAPDALLLERGRQWRAQVGGPVVMFASSREGEEAEFFRILKDNRELAQAGWARRATDIIAPHVEWMVVPRHPQRFDEVAGLARECGLSVSRRSAWGAQPQAADVWIGDSLGEMAFYYGLADVALLGGSFEPLGGQNLIEAAACSCPLVMGPHTFNFAEAAQLALDAGAALRVDSMEEGVRTAVALAGDAPRREAAVHAAVTFAAAHQGAADKTARAILAVRSR
jgi:3-deoxy-D-manno-octulosonic-acid transferase